MQHHQRHRRRLLRAQNRHGQAQRLPVRASAILRDEQGAALQLDVARPCTQRKAAGRTFETRESLRASAIRQHAGERGHQDSREVSLHAKEYYASTWAWTIAVVTRLMNSQ